VLGGAGTLDVSVGGHHTQTIDVGGTPRLYTLYQAGSATGGTLLLHASPGVQAYDFIFGQPSPDIPIACSVNAGTASGPLMAGAGADRIYHPGSLTLPRGTAASLKPAMTMDHRYCWGTPHPHSARTETR
jgi:hypothetical protein